MIQFERRLYGLEKLNYDYQDTSPNSRDIFRILDLPETFNLGKNQFKILANPDFLLKKSKIYIDIIDENDEAIYYEVSPIANNDNSRSIIVYIYHDTPPGNCRIFIASRLYKDPRDKSDIFFNENIRDEPNVVWSTVVNVSPYQESAAPIKFISSPIVSYKERIQPLQTISGSTRLVNLRSSGSDRVSMTSIESPKQLISDRTTVETYDISKKLTGQPIIASNLATSDPINLPVFSDLSMIRSDNQFFSSSMVGGKIYVNGITIDYPGEAIDSSSFFNVSYSASIIRVINGLTAEVYPPFVYTAPYTTNTGITKLFTAKSFYNVGNFTASYYATYDLTSSLTTQSFLEINAFGIDSVSGFVDSLNVSYKPVTAFGDFKNIGDFEVDNKNLLVDSSSIKFDPISGIIERPIGEFPSGSHDFRQYWVSGSVNNAVIFVYGKEADDMTISDGILIKQGSSFVETAYNFIHPKLNYAVYGYKDTEFDLSFSSYLEPSDVDDRLSQIDIYVSGSIDIKSTAVVNDSLLYSPIKSATLGSYIGSVTSRTGILKSDKLSFILRSSGTFIPKFVLRSGIWSVGNIEIRPRKERGFGPNQTRIYVPLTDVTRETELTFRVQYNDKYGIRSDESTKLYGLYFQGSSPIEFSEIQNVPNTIGNPISYAASYRKVYITQSSAQVNTSSAVIQWQFPIFTSEIDGSVYTGSTYHVGLGYQIDTVIFGRTGSVTNPTNTYTWAGSIQGRAIVTNFDNSGQPLLFRTIGLSGSSVNSLGTFGPGPNPPKTDLDSWLTFNLVDSPSGNLLLRYNLRPTSSFSWDVYASSVCTVWKYEQYNGI